MNFQDALTALKAGKSVKRRKAKDWLINHPHFKISFYKPDTRQIIWLGDAMEEDYYISSDDLLAEDWEIVE